MHVLMTADTIGGVWNYALELARALVPFDVRISLATMGAPLSTDQCQSLSQLQNVELYKSGYKLCWMESPWMDVERAAVWLRDLVEHLQPDVVHLNDFGNSGIDWQRPSLLVAHSCVYSWFDAVHGCQPDATWSRYRTEVVAGLERANWVVAPTAAMLQAIVRMYGVSLEAASVISNARDPDDFPPRDKRQFVFCAGRLWDEAKNTATLARAAKMINWPVAIAGDAVHPDGTTTCFPGVQHVGRLSRTEMAVMLGAASIYAAPARYEPFGLSILEAALAGAALVLGDLESLREIWGDDALYVAPHDEEALAVHINRLIEDPALRNEYARRARCKALQYSPRVMAQSYVDVYRHLLRANQTTQLDSRSPASHHAHDLDSSTQLSPTGVPF